MNDQRFKDFKDFLIRENIVALQESIKTIKEGYIPAYINGKIDFSPLLKEIFWLVELELKVRGIKVEHSFQGILKAVKDKNHIVNDAFEFRKNPPNDKEKKVFVEKLKKYLDRLEKSL